MPLSLLQDGVTLHRTDPLTTDDPVRFPGWQGFDERSDGVMALTCRVHMFVGFRESRLLTS